jgi:group II intron reverse transcriptase/maturase
MSWAEDCQIPQSEIVKQSIKIFTRYKKKIEKSSDKISLAFTLQGIQQAYTEFQQIICSSSVKGRLNLPIYSLLANPCYLLIAYSTLQDTKSMDINNIPLSNITLGGIKKLAEDILSRKYKPLPARRVFIPKVNGKMRPLGISSSRDKIIQQALNMLLVPLFEPTFSKNSHGFRKGYSCHSSIRDIYLRWRKVKWFMEFDLLQCFDRINHLVLLSEIDLRINDYWTLRLLDKLLKAGYIHFGGLSDSYLENRIGTPQGSILSPLLCNILLTPLDYFVEGLCSTIFVERQKIVNPDYNKLHRGSIGTSWADAFKHIKDVTGTQVSMRDIRKCEQPIRSQIVRKENIPYYAIDPLHRKLLYTRYADDFLMSFVGPKSEACAILCKVVNFLSVRLLMNVNIDKTGVKHHEKGVLFLGFTLKGQYSLNQKLTQSNNSKQRVGDVILKIGIPLEKLFQRFTNRGLFAKGVKTGGSRTVGRRVDKWLFLNSDYEVIVRFNSVINGVRNYYSASTQRSVLDRFWWAMRQSAALTIAHRHKKRSAKWAYEKYGLDLTVKNEKGKEIKLLMPKVEGNIKFQGRNCEDLQPVLQSISIPITPTAVVSAQELDCSIPNCTLKADHWYHIRHRKKFKGPERKRSITAYCAKQIPVCLNHHKLIHAGKYDGPSLRKIRGFTPSDFNY